MNKTTWILIAIGITLVGVYFVWPHTLPNELNTQSTLSLNQDLYPLFSSAEWNVPVHEEIEFGTTTVPGVEVSSVPVMDTMSPASYFAPFESFYAEKLSTLGWKIDNSLAAGGPMGGQTGYRKAGELIILRYRTVFHTVTDTAPSECPCDVTLTLFSAK